MPVSRLRHIPGIGVDEIGDAADAAGNPGLLRLENLDTDVPPPAVAREVTHAAVEADDEPELGLARSRGFALYMMSKVDVLDIADRLGR
jgi:hypothetical protein